MVGILYCRLHSFSQPILQIPVLVIVMLQQGLIWRVQVSPQRKLNFLLICISILIIILLIKTAWQTFYHVFPWKQLQSPLMFSTMSCQWLLQFKNTAFLLLNNCMTGQKHCVCLTSCCMHLCMYNACCKAGFVTMSSINADKGLWWCVKAITGDTDHWEIQYHGSYLSDIVTGSCSSMLIISCIQYMISCRVTLGTDIPLALL